MSIPFPTEKVPSIRTQANAKKCLTQAGIKQYRINNMLYVRIKSCNDFMERDVVAQKALVLPALGKLAPLFRS